LIDARVLTGADLSDALDKVAALRISVFRDFPYLYDGDLDYERRYLETYRQSSGAVLVGAFDGQNLIGAATGAPLAEHASEFADAFDGTGIDLDTVFYCAESVLLPQYRGRGIGHLFFDRREEHARGLGFTRSAFCAVIRASDHPQRPPDYRPLDAFWHKRGYAPLPGVTAVYSWKDLGETEETAKPMQFWMRDL
jgi:GNAT superfamily N-acetyltransferase